MTQVVEIIGRKQGPLLFCIVNIMAVDGLVTQVARPSAAMVLT